MSKIKGSPKTGGRTKGVKNKRTAQWETFSDYCLIEGLQKFKTELDKLTGKDFIQAFSLLLEYHAPKLARVETKVEEKVTHIVIEKTIIGK